MEKAVKEDANHEVTLEVMHSAAELDVLIRDYIAKSQTMDDKEKRLIEYLYSTKDEITAQQSQESAA